jgi:hypothetical protein
MNKTDYSRRDTMKMLGLSSSAGLLGLFGGVSNAEAREAKGTPEYAKAMKPVKNYKCKSDRNGATGFQSDCCKSRNFGARFVWVGLCHIYAKSGRGYRRYQYLSH